MSLTPHAVYEIFQGRENLRPTVQVMELKPVTPPDGAPQVQRYKMKISDGEYLMQAMLGTKLNHLVSDGHLAENSVIVLDEYMRNDVHGRTICIVISMTVASPSHHRVGNPVPVESAMSGGAPPASSAAPPSSSVSAMARSSAGPTASTGGRLPQTRPISALNPYSSNWAVKVRVTTKGDKKSWSNDRGEGTLFSCDLLDEYGTEIRATFFREGCEKYFDLVEAGKVYIMSGGRVKVGNRYSKGSYDLNFDGRSTVTPVDNDSRIKSQVFSFVSINDIAETPAGSVIDVIGVVKDVGPESNITTKAGKDLTKRDLTIVDRSTKSVTLTLWGERASTATDSLVNSVVAVKGVKVGDYGGRSLSTLYSSVFQENPDISEAHTLKGWWDSEGSATEVQSLTSSGGGGGFGPSSNAAARKTMASIKMEDIGRGSDKGEYLTVKGTVSVIRADMDRPPYYPACPSCNKKASPHMSGSGWSCEGCGSSFEKPEHRYVLNASIVDSSGADWVGMFQDQGLVLLDGMTANQLDEIKETNDMEQWSSVFMRPRFREYLFRLRVKIETRNDEERTKTTVQSLQPIDYAKESRVLLNALDAYDTMPVA